MLTRIRQPAKLPCHMYTFRLVSCSFLLSRQLLSNTFCLSSSMKLDPGFSCKDYLLWSWFDGAGFPCSSVSQNSLALFRLKPWIKCYTCCLSKVRDHVKVINDHIRLAKCRGLASYAWLRTTASLNSDFTIIKCIMQFKEENVALILYPHFEVYGVYFEHKLQH